MFYTVLYQPLFNLLIFLYDIIPGKDLGFAIIGISVVIKLVLWPFTRASLKSQKMMQELQPKLDALKVEYKDNQEAQAKAMMELYKSEKVNPLASCLPLLVQLPILIALYSVLRAGLKEGSLSALYPFISNPGSINAHFLGLIDLSQPHVYLAIIAGILQFFQTRMLLAKRPPANLRKKDGAKDEDAMASMNQTMMYMMPVMTTIIGFSLPGGLTLYWIIMNALAIFQQYLVLRSKSKSTAPTPVITEKPQA